MAREAKAIPKAWKDHGVWGVLDIDGQHDLVDEFEALDARLSGDGESLTQAETARHAHLKAEMDTLVCAKVLPYSHDEYARVEAAKVSAGMSFSSDSRGNVKVKKMDPRALTGGIELDIIETRVCELTNYAKVVPTRLDKATGEVLETERVPLTTGAAVAEFLRSADCPDSEQAVSAALIALIKSQSHLEAALGKWSASRRASSPATTRLSGGGALAAIPSTSTPAQM